MTSKVKGTEGIEFPDSTVQGSAAYTKAESDGPAFSAKRTTSQTGSVSGTPFKLICDVEAFDTADAYDAATGRFQPTVAGYYQVGASVEYGPVAANSIFININKNGAAVNRTRNVTNGSLSMSIQIDSLVYLNGSTDYIEFFWTQNSGATMNVLAESYCYGSLARKA